MRSGSTILVNWSVTDSWICACLIPNIPVTISRPAATLTVANSAVMCVYVGVVHLRRYHVTVKTAFRTFGSRCRASSLMLVALHPKDSQKSIYLIRMSPGCVAGTNKFRRTKKAEISFASGRPLCPVFSTGRIPVGAGL